MNTVRCLLLLLLVALVSCKNKSDNGTRNIEYAYLFTSWTHSFEEQNVNDTVSIFRLDGYKDFPPSRYREQLRFAQDGACSYLVLSPDDGHYIQKGKWQFADREKSTIEIDDSSGSVYRIVRIVELKQDLLRIVVVQESSAH